YSRQAVDQLNLVNTVMLDGTWQAYQAGVYQASDILRQLDAAQTALNQETGKVITGVSSRQQAVRSAVKKMADAGITGFIDHGGHRWSPEAYVRMDIKTTCSNAARQAVFDRNKDYGNDLVWVRINATARPGCYPWQGKVISTEGRSGVTYDLDDKPIPFYSIHDTTYGQPDGLWGINCHHGPPNVFLPGLSSIRGEVPSADDNAAAYELTQRQRQLERQVRYAKREAAMLDAAGDKEGFDQAALRVKQRQQALRDFAEANNLPLSGDRTQVMVYNRSVAGKVNAAAAQRTEPGRGKDAFTEAAQAAPVQRFDAKDYSYRSALESRFAQGSDTARRFYDKYVPSTGTLEMTSLPPGESARYFPGIRKICMDLQRDSANKRGIGTTWFHEHGHLADHAAGYISHSQAFADALRKDFTQYTAKVQQEKGLAFREWAYGSIRKRLHSSDAYHSISDLYDAMSDGQCAGNYAHKREYWKQSPYMLTEEAFAHMFEASFDEQQTALMKEFLPESFAMFEDLMGGAL
ncbi:MAG: phage minor capsid protein, partial [Aristaeellaceae bacterium]